MSITSVRMSPEVSVIDLTVSQLRALEHFLARQFPVGSKLRTLEIGCGNGTALFSKHSFRHVSVCEDSDLARAAAASVEHAPEFQAQSVRFVFADDKRALDILAEEEPLDIVMIGGPRHPEMLVPAFLALSKRLRRDSILVLRDVHVPTINQLYRILSEDDDLQQVTEIENTVFFWCSGAPSGERIHSGWRRYNDLHRRFQIDATYSTGDVLPLKRTFDGWMRDLPRCFKRGAIISRGMPLIAGRWSVLEFQLVQPYSGDFRVVFDIDVVEATSSNSVKCEINGSDKGTVSLSKGPSQLQYRANFEAVTTVEIKLYCSGSTRPAAYFVRSITIEPVAAQSAPAVGLTWIDGSIATFEAFGTTVSFFVHDPHDTIQAHHAVGPFYEAEERSLLAQNIALGARVLDVGSHIGKPSGWV